MIRRAAIVTAAGLSSRMGRPKALLDWGGKPLLQHQLDALAEWEQVVIVLGHEADRLAAAITPSPRQQLVHHPEFHLGRSTSLAAGAAALEGDPEAILIVGVDQPLDPSVLPILLSALESNKGIVIPTHAGRRGHPLLLGGDHLRRLRELAREPEGLRTLIQAHAEQVRLCPISSPWTLLDMNEPGDYDMARSRMQDRSAPEVPARNSGL